ncbi:hypothetical protein BVX99_01995 [bacterium F16]|nr:hypothetical protein BVX99_01995 [bacterium F16]
MTNRLKLGVVIFSGMVCAVTILCYFISIKTDEAVTPVSPCYFISMGDEDRAVRLFKTYPDKMLMPCEPSEHIVEETEDSMNGGDSWEQEGLYPLSCASAYGRLKVIRYLVSKGVDTDVLNPSCDRAALHIAVENNQMQVVKLLVNLGAKIDVINNSKNTPLHYVSAPKVAEFLLKNGAASNRLDSNGKTPIQSAILRQMPVNLLLTMKNSGCDPKINGHQSLKFAVSSGNIETIEFLLESGVSQVPAGESDEYALIYACDPNNDIKERLQIVNCLMTAGFNPNLVDRLGYTALRHAVAGRNKPLVELLCKNGADLKLGHTLAPPIVRAVWDDEFEIVDLLIKAGERNLYLGWYTAKKHKKEKIRLYFEEKLKKKGVDMNKWYRDFNDIFFIREEFSKDHGKLRVYDTVGKLCQMVMEHDQVELSKHLSHDDVDKKQIERGIQVANLFGHEDMIPDLQRKLETQKENK